MNRHATILLALGAILMLGVAAHAASPPLVSYQGTLTDGQGQPLDGTFDLHFTIYPVSQAMIPVLWSESHIGVPVTGGLFHVILGSINPLSAPVFDDVERWLGIAIDAEPELLPRTRITSVPYALRAAVADSVLTGAGDGDWVISGNDMYAGVTGRVGIGTSSPSRSLELEANQSVLRMSTNTHVNGSVLELRNKAASPTLLGAINFLHNATVPGQIAYAPGGAIGAPAVHEMKFRVGGITPAILRDDGMELYGAGQYTTDATLRSSNFNPAGGMAGYFWNNSDWATTHMENNGRGEVLWLQHNGTGDYLVCSGVDQWEFWVDNGGVTHARVLEILGGSDLSERFDVDDEHVEPGTVVSIDSEHEGRLVVSRRPYDRAVAGIVSGAGGVNPGMLMGQKGSVADGEHPVALSGRVYCRATASNGPIVPGDLLTTSNMPGHAMRVDDPSLAQGAILGKAMGRLDEGEDLVLVLVGLQ